jgi:Somatomedin B domain
MTLARFVLPFLFALPVLGCSSSDDGSTDPSGGAGTAGDARRVSLGKADTGGHCKTQSKSYCGGKSNSKCWCDAACVDYGDCCSDYQNACGSSSGAECNATSDCPSGQYCEAQNDCASPGVCKPKPNVMCTEVVTQYCSCEGETKTSPTGCIFDRFDHKGACDPAPKSCGGFAGLPCAGGELCVDNPNDGCDPNAGGADCPGICVAKQMCGGIAGIQCPSGQDCVDDPSDGCDPAAGGADCSGMCVPAAAPAPNSCVDHCGKQSADKSCWCDGACKGYGDCCADYDAACSGRTPVSGSCIKSSGDTCSTDADCKAGGCGGELCYNPQVSSGISTCNCAAPTGLGGCGCVAGQCTWYQ